MSGQPVIVTDGDYFSVAEEETALHQGVNHQRHPATPGPKPPPPAVHAVKAAAMPRWRHAKRTTLG